MELEPEVVTQNMDDGVPNMDIVIPNVDVTTLNMDNSGTTSDENLESSVTMETLNTLPSTEASVSSSWTIGDGNDRNDGEETGIELRPTQDRPEHQVIDMETVEGSFDEQAGSSSSNGNVESNVDSPLPTDHEHSHSQVIEVEEFPNDPNIIHDQENCAEMDSVSTTCNCNCHTKLDKGKTIIMNSRNTEQSASTTVTIQNRQSNQSISSYVQSNQSNSPLSSVTNQSSSSSVRFNQSGPSVVKTNSDVEIGVQNPAFNVARVDSNLSRASNNSVKPPAYKSLGEFYLHDEPPKYENITGNKLADQLQDQTTVPPARPVPTRSRLSCKSRVAGAFILFGIILITGLLVYLSVTSESSQQPNSNKS